MLDVRLRDWATQCVRRSVPRKILSKKIGFLEFGYHGANGARLAGFSKLEGVLCGAGCTIGSHSNLDGLS